MAVDLAGFITYLKEHAVEHAFHVHDERHFIETYSLRQSWEIDLHPEAACDGPLDLNLAFDVEPRVVLGLEDRIYQTGDPLPEETGEFRIPLLFNWALPPLKSSPDLLVLATDLAGIGGPDLPIEVSAVDAFGAVADGAEHRLLVTGRVEVSLVDVMAGREKMCDILDRCLDVSEFLLGQAEDRWGTIDTWES